MELKNDILENNQASPAVVYVEVGRKVRVATLK